MSTNINIGLKGLYKLGKKDSNGNIICETGWIENLITDFGLNSGFTSSFSHQFCAVGSGNTAPSFSDTQLVSQIGSRTSTVTATSSGNSGSPSYYYFLRRTFEFPLSGIIGNIAEVMLAATASTATAFSRSLAKDGAGNPITFPVLSGEQLYVIYELREYRNLSDAVGSITLESISYPYLIRSCNVGNNNSLFNSSSNEDCAPSSASAVYALETNSQQPNTGAPSTSGGVTASSNSMATYVANTFYRDVTYTWTPAIANFTTGIGAFAVRAQTTNSILKYAIYLTGSKIPKVNTKSLTLTIRWTLTRV